MMYLLKKALVGICFLLMTLTGWAQPRMQSSSQATDQYRSFKVSVQAEKLYSLALASPATGIAVEIPLDYTFEGMYLLAGADTFLLSENIHVPEEVKNTFATRTSNLVVLNNAITQISLYSSRVTGELVIHTVFAGETPGTSKKKAQELSDSDERRSLTEACQKPVTVDQAIWRDGLEAPHYTPQQNQVKHLIIHHSVTSNSASDYYNVVRNIYLYHTNVNKWSDIGYNYLIAPDGTIFEGREDFSTFGEDNVLGAHFCAKNAGTMGVCMLGDYSGTQQLTEAALSSLKVLLAWKATKENLDVNASNLHPVNHSSAQELGVIAGHRNGCATECPGENVYSRLLEIRSDVYGMTESCKTVAGAKDHGEQKISIVPHPAHDQVRIHFEGISKISSISIFTITGFKSREWTLIPGNSFQLDLTGLKAGLYIIAIETEKGRYSSKLIVEQ